MFLVGSLPGVAPGSPLGDPEPVRTDGYETGPDVPSHVGPPMHTARDSGPRDLGPSFDGVTNSHSTTRIATTLGKATPTIAPKDKYPVDTMPLPAR